MVVDHGYGLMSLYGHLSSIEVKEGQAVTRGQTLGRTGDTGLAGGDHLHFAILLQWLAREPRRMVGRALAHRPDRPKARSRVSVQELERGHPL